MKPNIDQSIIGLSPMQICLSPMSKKPKKSSFTGLLLHIHPHSINEKVLTFTHTFGLGGMAATLLILLVITGILLKFVYQPFPGNAYLSILTLENGVLFGKLIRNIHRWSANLLVIVSFLHLLRVFYTGALYSQRRTNWFIGLCLFFLVLASNFTGYLLPWDQLAYWAITICTGMLEYIPLIGSWLQKIIRGGPDVGPTSLSIFYTLHTAVMPFILILLSGFHFWRIRKDGGVIIPKKFNEIPDSNEDTTNNTNDSKQNQSVPVIPNLVTREIAVALILIAVIFVFSTFFNAPLQDKANPGLSPNPAKAPWYFMGFQEMLMHFHPIVAILIIPLLTICALIALPYLNQNPNTHGIRFQSQKGQQTVLFAVYSALIVTPAAVLLDEFYIHFTTWLPRVSSLISNGLIPFILIISIVTAFYFLVRKKYTASFPETIQAVFTFLTISFIILTIIGTWFRGPGMSLAWPWNTGTNPPIPN